MSGPLQNATGVSGVLTDGTGVSQILASKFIKDLVLDFLLSLPAVFVAINVTDLEGAVAMPVAVVFGLGDATIRWLYRAALRWAQS